MRAGEVLKAMFDQSSIGGPAYREHLRDVEPRMTMAELLVAVDPAGTVLGSVTYMAAGTPYALVSRGEEAEIRMLGVSEHRNKARTEELLVRACIQRARRDGRSALVMCTLKKHERNPGRLYRRLGFTLSPGRGISPMPGLNLVVFRMPLDASPAGRRWWSRRDR